MLPLPPEFLVVDENRDNRFLLSKTLTRKFPGARIVECDDAETALKVPKEAAIALAIVHRAADADALTLIADLRKLYPTLLILAVSGHDRRDHVLRAGANAFLHYDGWLSVGRVVEDMLRIGQPENPQVALDGNGAEPVRASAKSALL